MRSTPPTPAPTASVSWTQQALAEKTARDRELNRRREEEARRRAVAAELEDLIRAHRVQTDRGDLTYNFADGQVVKRVSVTPDQRRQLANGQLAVVRDGAGYALVPVEIAQRIRARDEAYIVLLNQPYARQDPADPYAQYKVPDDLCGSRRGARRVAAAPRYLEAAVASRPRPAGYVGNSPHQEKPPPGAGVSVYHRGRTTKSAQRRDYLDEVVHSLGEASTKTLNELVKEMDALVVEPKSTETVATDPNPFFALFDFSEWFDHGEPIAESEDIVCAPRPESEIEEVIRSQALLDARRRCLEFYNRAKQALKMPVWKR